MREQLAHWVRKCSTCGTRRSPNVRKYGECRDCAEKSKARRKIFRTRWIEISSDREYAVLSKALWVDVLTFNFAPLDYALRNESPFVDECVCAWCDGKMGNSNQALSSLLPNFPHPEEDYCRGEAACWRCYNKYRRLDAVLIAAESVRLSIGRVQQEICNERKRRKVFEDNGRHEAISC